MKITLYTIHCPNCKVLEKLLERQGIEFEVFEDKDKMIEMGIKSAPMLKVDDELMTFKDAVKWINGRQK